jgi:hypothetical protein
MFIRVVFVGNPPVAPQKLNSTNATEGSCMDGARGARERSDFFAKRSGAAMYPTCFRLED